MSVFRRGISLAFRGYKSPVWGPLRGNRPADGGTGTVTRAAPVQQGISVRRTVAAKRPPDGAFIAPVSTAPVTGALVAVLILGSAGCGLRRAATAPMKNPPPPLPLFADVAEKAGVSFSLGHNGKTPLTILETLGSGGGFLDCDGDGWLDIVLVGPNKTSLFRNNGDGTFTDATVGSGLRQTGTWQGIATGDYDNDGRPDLFVSGYRDAALYHNEGAGRFREVTKTAGVESRLWGASAAFFDADNDGRLDLLVAHYVQFYPTSTKFCLQGGLMSTCGPTNYDPEKPTLYRNNGDGTFSDETKKRGPVSYTHLTLPTKRIV